MTFAQEIRLISMSSESGVRSELKLANIGFPNLNRAALVASVCDRDDYMKAQCLFPTEKTVLDL